ncbi:MAG TPA: insulinase family protein, partial [Polyangia bacterium]
FGGTELFGRADTQENRARALGRVRPEDIRAVARRVFRRENLAVTVVGALSPTQSRRVEKIVRGFR